MTADLVMYDKVTLDCQSEIQGFVEQTFGVQFKVQTSSNAQAFYKSGNPGYIVSMPLLVSSSNQGLKQVDQAGLRLFSGDKQGNCFDTLSSLDSVDFDITTVRFGENLKLNCFIELNAEQLKEYC
jgi:hypothetical protein